MIGYHSTGHMGLTFRKTVRVIVKKNVCLVLYFKPKTNNAARSHEGGFIYKDGNQGRIKWKSEV